MPDVQKPVEVLGTSSPAKSEPGAFGPRAVESNEEREVEV